MLRRIRTDTDSESRSEDSQKGPSSHTNIYIRKLEMMKDMKKRKDSSTHSAWENNTDKHIESLQEDSEEAQFIKLDSKKQELRNRKRNQSDPQERQDQNAETDCFDEQKESSIFSSFKKEYAKRKTSLCNPNTPITMEVLLNVTEFISYNIKKEEMTKETIETIETEMQKFPLEVLEEELRSSLEEREEWERKIVESKEQTKEIEEQTYLEIKELEKEGENWEIKIIQMVNDRAENRERSRSVRNLNDQIQEKFASTSQEFERRQNIFSECKRELINARNDMHEGMVLRKIEIANILEIKEKIKTLKENLFIENKMQESSKLIYDDLVKEVSLKNLKKDLERKEEDENAVSNHEILVNLEEKIMKKLSVFIHTIRASTENNKFMTNLKVLEKESDGKVQLTYENHILHDSEKEILENDAYYVLYNYFLNRVQKISKSQADLYAEHTKNDNLLHKVKKEIEDIKKWHEESKERLKEMESMQSIRELEIVELEKILVAKNLEFERYSNSKLDVFSSALMGFSMKRRSETNAPITSKQEE